MKRTMQIASREFLSVVLTRAFLIGILIVPIMMAVVVIAISLVPKSPAVSGRIVVLDQSGLVGVLVEQRFSDEGVREEAEADGRKVKAMMKDAMSQVAVPEATRTMVDKQIEEARKASPAGKGSGARLSVELLKPDADIEKVKDEIRVSQIRAGSDGGTPARLALVIIPEGAVRGASDPSEVRGESDVRVMTWEPHEVFVNPQLDFELQTTINRRVGEAIVDARVASDPRFQNLGLSPARLRELMHRPSAEVKSLTREGEKQSAGALQILVPVAFMILLMMSVMSGGQYLMTALIEEKSNRVMEVLLSAVSPMQLMLGKILGMMGVALLLLAIFGGLGMAGLVAFALADLVPLFKLVWLGVFFIFAFFTIASLMAAIGAAVNEMREAQTLLSPVMMMVMVPWFLWLPISRAPNSTFATVMSFVPALNPFVMVIRMGGSEPIPAWHYPAAAGVAMLSAMAAAWASAKVFRVGVLMYGKPPNLSTLIRWVRMA